VVSNTTVALVIDDIVSRNPWRVRCLEIRGTAEPAESGERRTEPNDDEIDTAIIRITPRRIIGFGIDDTETEPHKLAADSRDVPTTAD
jgi:pyridoxamine 5'-phosphate oxidase family protein